MSLGLACDNYPLKPTGVLALANFNAFMQHNPYQSKPINPRSFINNSTAATKQRYRSAH